MKVLITSLTMLMLTLTMLLLSGCPGDQNGNGGFPLSDGECHLKYSQKATFDLEGGDFPFESTQNRLRLEEGDCPFAPVEKYKDIGYAVNMANPFESDLNGYELDGTLTNEGGGFFSYDIASEEMATALNPNCMVSLMAEGMIEVDGFDAEMRGDLEIWLKWSANGSPCAGFDLL